MILVSGCSPQEQRGHGYLSTAALAAAGRPAQLDQLKIQVANSGRRWPAGIAAP